MFLPGFMGSIRPPITLTYTALSHSPAGAASYTFPNLAISTADSKRKVVVGVSWYDRDITLSSATIGGITATQVLHATTADRSWASSIIVADVPTGATATVVINLSAVSERCVVDVWAMYNASSSTPSDTSVTANQPSVCSNTMTVEEGGCMVGILAGTGNAGNYRTITWSGATERSDRAIESDAGQSAADRTTVGSGVTISATASSNWNDNQTDVMLLASWTKLS